MKKIPLFVACCLTIASLVAQDNTFATAESSDPKAKAILEDIRAKYDKYTSIYAEFTLSIELPEQPAETQKGTIAQSGDKYHIDLPAQALTCNGSTLWVHLKNNNEVQINNTSAGGDEAQAILSPKDLLKMYEQGNFAYALTYEGYQGKQSIQQIEFKPLDADTEYAKMRLTIDKKNKTIKSIKAFAKDGSRYTLTIDNFQPNKAFSTADFQFNPKKYPNIYIEDLRID